MTYALSQPLKQAIYALLAATPAVQALVADRIYDAAPELRGLHAPEGLYAVIGDEEVNDWSTKTDRGSEHFVTIAVYAPREGFAEAKAAAGAISEALLDGQLNPARGHVVGVYFIEAETEREDGNDLRRVSMTFRIVVEDTL